MPTTTLDLQRWFENGVKLEATYLIVVADSYDYSDYPAYVMSDEDVHERINHYRLAPMQRVREVYDLNKDKTEQLNEGLSFNFPPWPAPAEPKSDSD